MVKTKSQKKGEKFEKLIEDILKKSKKMRVKRNVHKYKKTKNNGTLHYQIDIIYGFFSKTYVECKYHSNSYVGLSEVSKFYSVLELLNNKKGEMYTNTDYVPRAKEYAKKHKIKLYNGKDILKMYKKTRPLLKRMFIKNITIDDII